MTCRYKNFIAAAALICTLFSVSHAGSSTKSNSETHEAVFHVTDLTRRVLTAGNDKNAEYTNAVPSTNYTTALLQIYVDSTPTEGDVKNIIDALIYDVTIIPSSKNIQQEWGEITRILAYIKLLATPATTGQIADAFTSYYNKNSVILHTALANMGFTLNTYPDIESYWRTRTRKEYEGVLIALRDHQHATTKIEDTSFGHDQTIVDNCNNEEYLRTLFTALSDPNISYLSAARLSHFVLKYFNSGTSKNEPLISQREANNPRPIPKRFLQKQDNRSLIEKSLASVIRRLETLNLPYWRYKTMEYLTGLLYTLQLDYGLPIEEEWLDGAQKSILSQNAKLIDWALAVEGGCPSTLRFEGRAIECDQPSEKPKTTAIISTIKQWYHNDIHPLALYPTTAMMNLAERLAQFSQLDRQQLIVDKGSIYQKHYNRHNVEQRVRLISLLNHLVPIELP